MTQVRIPPAPGTHRHRVHEALSLRVPAGDDTATRWLSGVAAFRDRDGARALRLVGDDSQRVRGVAFVVAPLACDDREAAAALRVAWSVRGERRLLRRMRRAERLAAIDAFLEGLARDGHLLELVDDLPFGSEPCVRRFLPHALERPSHRFWDGLAVSHPAVLADLLEARWRAVEGEADPVTRQLTERHHRRLADRVPQPALRLVELLLERGIEPAQAIFTELLRKLPAETVEVAVRHAARVPAGVFAKRLSELEPSLLGRVVANAPHLLGEFGPRVRTLSDDRRRALSEAWRDASARFPACGTHLLRFLPDDELRAVAYERWSLAARDRDGVIAADALAALPIELAAKEARRHLFEVVALEIAPARRLSGIARYLPFADLERAVADQLGHPDGATRSLALTELLANAGVYPDDTTLPARALERVLARKFEQDPVRGAMFETLARWPRRVWKREHLPAVGAAVRDALDAADLSISTASAAQRLVARLFGVDGAWAADLLATTIKERGALYDPNFGAKLSDADVRIAAPHLLAIVEAWTTQERAYWLVAFANGLGPRLHLVPGLGELLAHARTQTPWEWIATQFTETLARHDPDRHAATLEAVVRQYRERRWFDATFALAELHGLVGHETARRRSRRRPTLPEPLSAWLADIARSLDQNRSPQALAALSRRDPRTFDRVTAEVLAADASVAAVAPVQRWIHRHRQDLLEPYLDGARIRGRFASGKTSWILPFADGFFRWTPDAVGRFARALEAIVLDPRRDTPAVFDALTRWPRMEYASMDRLLALARDERPAIREKAIRVLARCDAGQGVPTLLACLADERARFAIYGLRRALFGMVGDRALALLTDVPMKKVTVAKEVVRLTGELRAAGSFARLRELSSAPLHRDVRIALLRALWDHLDRPETWTLFEAAVTDPDWVVASRLADIPANRLTTALDASLSALLARLVARPEPEARIDLLRRAALLSLVDRQGVFLDACRARLRSPYDDETRAAVQAVLARSTEDDVPAFEAVLDGLREDPRALHVAAAALVAHDVRARRSHRHAAAALEKVALRDPRWSKLAVEASAARVLAGELVATLERLAEAGALDVDAAIAARDAVATLREEDLEATTAALGASRHAIVRRIAVWALERDAGPGRGWTPPRLALLDRLRSDAAAEVAGAAERVWPPREMCPSPERSSPPRPRS
ncbi:MAG: hypothetical protein JNL79_18685 [Myxococcales bacterium]|nr:hypothetical protein [Myxococcales bacterium]